MAKILPNASTAELAREVDDFFMRRDRVWRTMERLSSRLRAEGIDHAIVGEVINTHQYEEMSESIMARLS